MATYYLKEGFIVRIKRNTGSLFSGTIYKNGKPEAIFNPGIFSLELNYYLHYPGVYTFEFQNSSSTDPEKFEIYNYETLDLLSTITFPLNEPLVLISGITGRSNKFVCTCPDWGKATSYNQTLFSSSVRLRQWVLSNAGSKADCKHIMAAKRIMGIEQPTYTDPPYSAPPPPATPG